MPAVIFITPPKISSTADSDVQVWVKGMTPSYLPSIGSSYFGYMRGLTWLDKGITYYSDNAKEQYNATGSVYVFAAIGI